MTVQPPFGRHVRQKKEKSRRKAAFLLLYGTFADIFPAFSRCFWEYSLSFINFSIPARIFRREFSLFYESKVWKMTAKNEQNC